METIIRDIHGIRRIRIFVTCGIEGDADILRVGVFPVLTCLRILQPLVFYQIWKAEPGVMVEVDHFNMLMASDHTDGRYHLFQSLVVLVLIEPKALFFGLLLETKSPLCNGVVSTMAASLFS